MSYIETSIQLMREALKNPDNEWFMLLSESCIPITDFGTFYKYLRTKKESVINTKILKDKKFWKYKYKNIVNKN